jgi:hypothetical protein
MSFERQFMWHSDTKFAGHDSAILFRMSRLAQLGGVPKALAILRPHRSSFRQDDFRMKNASLSAIIVGLADTLVVKAGRRTIGGGGDSGLAIASGND